MFGNDLSTGHVIGVDIGIKSAREAVGSHPRVSLVEGSSTDRRTFERVQDVCAGGRAMVLLDSEHTERHVRAELDLYHELVPIDSYIVVNDTNIGGHPALAWKDSSPWDAVHGFIAEHSEFVIDPTAKSICSRSLRTGTFGGLARSPQGRRTSMTCSVPGSQSWNGRRSVARSSVTARTTPGVRADP